MAVMHFPPTDSDREWMRRYPGSWKGPVFKTRPCFICGQPGYTVPAPPAPITAVEVELAPSSPTMRTGDTCPGHEYAVRRVLFEHPEFDNLTGR